MSGGIRNDPSTCSHFVGSIHSSVRCSMRVKIVVQEVKTVAMVQEVKNFEDAEILLMDIQDNFLDYDVKTKFITTVEELDQ